MISRRALMGASLLALPIHRAVAGPEPEQRPDGRVHRFAFDRNGFTLDGKPFQIRAGEMHPVRIPRQHWRARIEMARAMGLNTVSICLMWNALEREPGVFDLDTDRNDIGAFLTLCREAGMWVYLRPGPYVCAEWDLGGLPYWLLRNSDIKLRSRDPDYLTASERYVARVATLARPFLVSSGGPILMVQVENEYASFGTDRAYMELLHDAWVRHGIDTPFSIADGLAQLQKAKTIVPDCAIGLDGIADIAGVSALNPDVPGWLSEIYPGWLTHWAEPHLASADLTDDLRKILQAQLSFNMYMVHGGTNFGLGAGANTGKGGRPFQPLITSYDYGAPIDEAGAPTKAFHTYRRLIEAATQRSLPPVPEAPEMTGFAPVQASRAGAIWDAFGHASNWPSPVSIERGLDQSLGMALYSTTIPSGVGGDLRLPDIHDYARLFLDGRDIATVSRLDSEAPAVVVPVKDAPQRLDILVDTFGHIGYGPFLGDRKGIDGPVLVGSHRLQGWQLAGLPLDAACFRTLDGQPERRSGNGMLFRATFSLPNERASTYVDMSAWRKGYVWVNGHLLGRFWHAGPQQRLYCPDAFLRPRDNRVLILDTEQSAPAIISGASTLA